ncbi:MAG: hypothetical protein QMD71_09420 [bacterium]|nr:hypothetical protein [bacterium]
MKDIFATCDYYTVKYNHSGTILWSASIMTGYSTVAHGVALTGSDIVGTGSFQVISGNLDYYTVKYKWTPQGIAESKSQIPNGSIS